MTKKHFQEMAELFGAAINKSADRPTLGWLVNRFEDFALEINPRFDAERFHKAVEKSAGLSRFNWDPDFMGGNR